MVSLIQQEPREPWTLNKTQATTAVIDFTSNRNTRRATREKLSIELEDNFQTFSPVQ
jgi:hypothetical protein